MESTNDREFWYIFDPFDEQGKCNKSGCGDFIRYNFTKNLTLGVWD